MISIIDYGLGNIKAFLNLYKRCNTPVTIARSISDLRNAKKIVLPGVGSFDYAVAKLNSSGMRDELESLVIKYNVPILGICVGMQILTESSEEGKSPGLGWIPGSVKKFDASNVQEKLILPHMGWNTIKIAQRNILLEQLQSDSTFYFLHSYYLELRDIKHAITETKYSINFTSGLNDKNIYGVQFHPEKSHDNGIQLLKNFDRLA